MLQNESILLVADNSGAKKLLIIRCLGGSNRRYSRIGDLVIATIKKVDPSSDNVKKGLIKKGQVVMALVVTTRGSFRRHNNVWIKFSKNCAVIVKKENKELVGTRVFVPLLNEFDDWGYKDILSLAPEVL